MSAASPTPVDEQKATVTPQFDPPRPVVEHAAEHRAVKEQFTAFGQSKDFMEAHEYAWTQLAAFLEPDGTLGDWELYELNSEARGAGVLAWVAVFKR